MAKLSGPLLSMGARGQIGKALVVSKWKGIPYARQHVIPANPRTTAQVAVRARFAFLREVFKRAPTELIDAFNAYATGRPLTGMNKFVGENARVLNGETDVSLLIFSPGARGGLPPQLVSFASSGAGELHATVTAPAAPDGWTLVNATLIAIHQQDPSGIFDGKMAAATDATAPYAPSLTGLTAGTYVAGVFLVWTKPDGSTAYSASVSGTQVVA